MSKWEEKRVKPVLPYYLAAAAMLVASLVLHPYTLSRLLLVAGITLFAYVIGDRFCPTRVVRTLIPYATGSEDVDALLADIAAKLDELHSLNDAIPDEELSAQIDRMEKAGRSIVTVVEGAPDKAKQVDRFARYYLPESNKIMAAYASLVKGGVKGENANQILGDVRKNAGTMATAFENQLDSLYSAEALDISTDIDVLDGILKSQNLAK